MILIFMQSTFMVINVPDLIRVDHPTTECMHALILESGGSSSMVAESYV